MRKKHTTKRRNTKNGVNNEMQNMRKQKYIPINNILPMPRLWRNKELQKMNQVSEFKNKEIAFLHYNRTLLPKRGYQITNTKNLYELEKILKIQNQQYNTYVTIATYSQIPRFPLNPKQHWPQFKEWIKIRDETITNIDFMLDFDATPTIQGITKAWNDTQKALTFLKLIIGPQAQYLTTWFSGNKGFHVLGKTKIITTAQDNINQQLTIAQKLKPLLPTLDTTIYDTARLRKLLGSTVNTDTFGKTRVIPIANTQEFNELKQALQSKNQEYFKNKPLTRLNQIKLQLSTR